MEKARTRIRTDIQTFLLVFLCFFLTSSAYLAWLYHLIDLTGPVTADLLTMFAGYVCQAAGVGVFAFLINKNHAPAKSGYFAFLLLHALCMIPAVQSSSKAGSIIFGLLMNLFCGMIAAWYLHVLAFSVNEKRRGLVFGCGYSAAAVAGWLLSLANGSAAFRILFCLVLTAICVLPALRAPKNRDDAPLHPAFPSPLPQKKLLILVCVTVFFLSLVKNIGFNFPSNDIAGGISLELSRTFYAAGLIIAGFVSDKSRKYGAILAFASSAIPFIMLALQNEPVSGMIFWCLDYFDFGFLSVFRIIVFSDIAKEKGLPFIAGFGLLFGRLGDAAGTGLYTLLSGSVIAVVAVTAGLFIVTVFLFFSLYQQLYMPAAVKQKSEQEIFERFALSHDLSQRERGVLRMILEEQTNSQIAEKLFVTESTIKYHIHSILQKTGCKNRKELMELYTTSR